MSIRRQAAVVGIAHLPVEVVFQKAADDVTLPQWQPRRS
jgi:hypothetical protein